MIDTTRMSHLGSASWSALRRAFTRALVASRIRCAVMRRSSTVGGQINCNTIPDDISTPLE